MNITPYAPNLSISTITNTATESLHRENVHRDLITQPAAISQSVAEKAVASDKKEQSAKKESSTKQQGIIEALKDRDTEVRQHEQAHHAAGGSTTGLPSYSFTTGPDGIRYATDGEVSVDLSIKQGDPAGTIVKMQQVKAAALAPADPSIQDLRVAASASQITLQAQAELITESENLIKAQQKKALVEENEGVDNNDPEHESLGFDEQINKTIADQEAVTSNDAHSHNEPVSRSSEVLARAGRVAGFYNEITQAYTSEAKHDIELSV